MHDTEHSLIICTYRRPGEVARLLRAVAGQQRVPGETLIVDGSPNDETEKVVRSIARENIVPGLTYFRVPPEHRGLTRQRNYGIARARGAFVSFLDDDTVPEADYFAATLACFARHTEAVGVGGFITNEVEWWRASGDEHSINESGLSRNGNVHSQDANDHSSPNVTSSSSTSSAVFKWGAWERREAYRWRLRKLLGLASELPPGWMPSAGHGRPVGYLPPDGADYRVEFFMGGSSTWRSEVFARHKFSAYFEGYGLYEDMDFCVRAARDGSLYLSTRARLAHHHAPAGRPSRFRYGRMVVRNGWFVWRRRHPRPPLASRARWWATTALLAACQLGDAVRGTERRQQLAEVLGRAIGMATLLLIKPKESSEPKDSGAAKATDEVAASASNA
jgi:GT2 family glycosyltransferase